MKNIFKVITVLLLIVMVLIPATPALALSPDTDLSTSDASFWGEDEYDYSGYSVSDVGDVNGDGFDDFLIGAYGDEDGGDPDAGQTYLLLGKASGWAMDTDLSAADASFWGEDAEDWSGISVSGAGDVNGDGYDDFLIGAHYDDDGGNHAGQTYLILGKASGWAIDTNLSAADASFWGEDANDYSGYSVSGAGDVNGDGYDDFLIGAHYDDDGGSGAGQTYLILGKASGWAIDTDLSTADASFWGEDANDNSGISVSGAGDVNGDGYDDFLIGAYGDSDGSIWAGQTYLILGKAAGWAMDTDLSAADASFWGEDAADFSGISVSAAGDVNGDGYDDIIIGAYANDDGEGGAGQTYLILGKASGWAMDTDLSTADASFWGEDFGDKSGCSVSGAGDVNGDTYDDFLIGAYHNDENGYYTGQTYLILGKATGWSMDTDLSAADASFWGEDIDDQSGISVSGAGDVNGDGYDDIIIGAYANDDGGNQAGQTYLFLSKSTISLITTKNIRVYQGNVLSGDSPAMNFLAVDVTIDFSACTGNGSVTVEEIDATPFRDVSVGRYWSLDSTGISNFTYDVTIQYTDTEITEADCAETDLRLLINDGTGWKKYSAAPDVATNSITVTGLTSMCDLAIADGDSSFLPPVSEILPIMFVFIGLMALGAFFWYRKRLKLAMAV